MFGLEDQKKKKTQPFVFELEKEVKDIHFQQDLKKKIETRVQKVKELLRNGEDKESFDKLAVLLHGYVSLAKVLSRLPLK